MSDLRSKPAWYDYPLYMRIFPMLKNYEHGYNARLRKRDAFEDYWTLYSVLVLYGAIRPYNDNYGGYYW